MPERWSVADDLALRSDPQEFLATHSALTTAIDDTSLAAQDCRNLGTTGWAGLGGRAVDALGVVVQAVGTSITTLPAHAEPMAAAIDAAVTELHGLQTRSDVLLPLGRAQWTVFVNARNAVDTAVNRLESAEIHLGTLSGDERGAYLPTVTARRRTRTAAEATFDTELAELDRLQAVFDDIRDEEDTAHFDVAAAENFVTFPAALTSPEVAAVFAGSGSILEALDSVLADTGLHPSQRRAIADARNALSDFVGDVPVDTAASSDVEMMEAALDALVDMQAEIDAGPEHRTVAATSGDDVITVGQLADGRLQVTVNGVTYTLTPGESAALTIDAGGGNDTVTVDPNVDIGIRINGGSGNDEISTGAGNDVVDAGAGNDSIEFGGGDDLAHGGSGDDTVTVGATGVGTTSGGVGGRRPGRNRVVGGAGDDTIDTGGGADHVMGGSGNDAIDGGAGNDSIDGGEGDDHLAGGAGDDAIGGGGGADQVLGGSGDDSIDGGSGDDLVVGGSGDDALDGGRDDDSVIGADGDDTISGGEGDDHLFGSAGDDTVSGGSGDDHVSGGSGDDRIEGGIGNDSLDGNDGDDTIDGGAGSDTVDGGNGDDTVDAGAGNDFVFGGDGADTIDGGAGNDYVDGNVGDDTIDGGAGKDVVYGSDGADDIEGGSGDDYIDGGNGDDELRGGDGDDVVAGGTGADFLSGNAGDDVIATGSGLDRVVDATDTADSDTVYAEDHDSVTLSVNETESSNVERLNIDSVLGSSIVIGASEDADFVARVTADLELFRQTPEGRELLESLDASGHTITIVESTGGNSASADDYDLAYRQDDGTANSGGGSGGTARINPLGRYNDEDSRGNPTLLADTPPSVVTFHELLHNQDYANGTLEQGQSRDPGGSATDADNNRELSVVGLDYDPFRDGTDGTPADGIDDVGDGSDKPDNPTAADLANEVPEPNTRETTENSFRDDLGLDARTRY